MVLQNIQLWQCLGNGRWQWRDKTEDIYISTLLHTIIYWNLKNINYSQYYTKNVYCRALVLSSTISSYILIRTSVHTVTVGEICIFHICNPILLSLYHVILSLRTCTCLALVYKCNKLIPELNQRSCTWWSLAYGLRCEEIHSAGREASREQGAAGL